VSPLDAFFATWSQARQTFGQGAPTGGAHFDGSAALRRLQTHVATAAPGPHWSGAAADAYGAANAEHAEVLGKLASLDSRLSAEVDRSAQIVSRGRDELEKVRSWVVSAAASVPDNEAGQTMLMSIVSKGLGRLSELMTTYNDQLNVIGATIARIGAEYASLRTQRFGPTPTG
jgi:hypothetical protein